MSSTRSSARAAPSTASAAKRPEPKRRSTTNNFKTARPVQAGTRPNTMVINNHHHSAEETSQSTPPLAHPIHSRKLIASFFALSAPVSSPRSAQDAPERRSADAKRRAVGGSFGSKKSRFSRFGSIGVRFQPRENSGRRPISPEPENAGRRGQLAAKRSTSPVRRPEKPKRRCRPRRAIRSCLLYTSPSPRDS